MMFVLPLSLIGYAWMCEEKVNVGGICVMLFLSGFSSAYVLPLSLPFRALTIYFGWKRWMYSSTLAYIVDANTGRSSSAVAANSCYRGTAGFIAAEVAVPLQEAIGDGGLYTLWAGILVVADLLILLIIWKGAQWREGDKEKEQLRQEKKKLKHERDV